MRRSPEAESTKEVTEKLLLLFGRDAEDVEHFFLELGFVDSEASATDFNAVKDKVVSFCPGLRELLGIEERKVFGFWSSEGVMDSIPLSLFFAPFEEGKVNDPKKVEFFVAWYEVLKFRDAEADPAEDVADSLPLTSAKENEIPITNVKTGAEGFFFCGREEFGDRRFPFTVFNLDISEAFCSMGDGELRQSLDLSGCNGGKALSVDSFNNTSAV